MSKNDPAFPTFDQDGRPARASSLPVGGATGLTVRQWMIGQVAAGLLGSYRVEDIIRKVDDLLAEEERTR